MQSAALKTISWSMGSSRKRFLSKWNKVIPQQRKRKEKEKEKRREGEKAQLKI